MVGVNRNWLVISCVLLLLVCVSLIALVLNLQARGEAQQKAVKELNARVKPAWVMAAIVAAALLGGPRPTIVLFAFVSFAALREFLSVPRRCPVSRSGVLASFFVVPVQYALVWTGSYGAFTLFIPVFVFFILTPLLVRDATGNSVALALEVQLGLTVCVYGASHLPALLMVRIPAADSMLLIVFVILVSQASDVMQYGWGKLAGKRPIAPGISPSKTVEGFAGGVLSASVFGAALWWITPFRPWYAALLSLVIGVTGFLGGLLMSAIKRQCGIKDWGTLIGGHGGVLDRIDSLCFAAPIFFHLTRYFF